MSTRRQGGLVQAVRLCALWVLVAACEVTPPVRLVTPAKSEYQAIRQAMGTEALFRERDGLTFSGTRAYPRKSDSEEAVERPVSLSLRPNGAFLLSVGVEESASSLGYDGRQAWTANPRGIAREVGLGAREHQLVDGWLRTSLWLAPGNEHFAISPVQASPEPQNFELRLKLIGQPIEATLLVDARTQRPLSYTITKNARVRRVLLDDWREIEGVWFPHEMTETLDGETLHVDRFVQRTRGAPRSFGKPPSLPTDVSFGPEASIETRVDQGGRFYVRASVGTLENAWMLLDTGFGSHAIHVGLADAAGMIAGEAAQLQGVSGAGSGYWVQTEQLTVGKFEQRAPRFITVDTSFLSDRAGFDVAGILGVPLFQRAVVTLDEPRGRVSLEDPQGFERSGLEWFPISQDGTSPCLDGHIVASGAVTKRLFFRLDTGSDDTVTIAEWAARSFHLIGDRANLRATRIEGAFGTILGWRKTLDAVELGPMGAEAGLRLVHPEATLLRSSAPGPLSNPWIAGNLGTRALRGCRVVLDLTAARISIQSDETK